MRKIDARSVSRGLAALFVAVAASATSFGQAPAANRYAGIEVGAKGVKAVVVEVGTGRPRNVMEAVSNTTLSQGVAKTGAFSESAIADTAEEAGKFAKRFRDEFHVPAEKISLIGSSGLPKAANRDALVKAVADSTKLAPMTFITPADEVKYTILALLGDESERAGSLLVDVGSGNTKGGFLTGADLVDFNIPFGSVTFENRVAAEVAKGAKPFAEVADQLRPTLLEAELAKQVAGHPELKTRRIVFLSGGAAYAMASLLKPQDSGKKQVDLTARDIAAYAALVRKPPISSPELDAVKGTDAEKDAKNVLDIFTPTNLVAGSEILTALASTLDLEGKTLRFDRTGVMALVRGRVLEQIEKDLPAPPPPPPPPKPREDTVDVPAPSAVPTTPRVPSKSLPDPAAPEAPK